LDIEIIQPAFIHLALLNKKSFLLVYHLLTIITKIFKETKFSESQIGQNFITYLDSAKVSESEQIDLQFEIEN
jgi:hypothetical protein